MLKVHHSGFYAWLKAPLSNRANEDRRVTELIKQAWQESGCVYGYRKIHDDLRSLGETCCPNRIARLAKLAGIKAQIGYKKRPGSYGGKPAVVAGKRQAVIRTHGIGQPAFLKQSLESGEGRYFLR